MIARKYWFALFGLSALSSIPWLTTIVGDAQVHLAFAEQFSRGDPFRYNPMGEITLASTSPFWTMLLAFLFRLIGAWTPLGLKLIVVLVWLGASYMLYRIARDVWQMRGIVLFAVIGLWLTQTTIVGNALGGLENILSALEVLGLYYLTMQWRGGFTRSRALALGALLGWAILTRLDGGLFCAIIVGMYLLHERSTSQRNWLVATGLLASIALIIVAPWYAYQYSSTGAILSDSSLARLYTGRRGSIEVIANLLYFHPKPLITLATAFLPLMLGLALDLIHAIAVERLRDRSPAKASSPNISNRENDPRVVAWVIGLAGFGFYTFVVGGDAFGRYFLPILPFYFLSGIAGLTWLDSRLQNKFRWHAPVALALAILFLTGVSGVDFYRRVVLERADATGILNVLYGPAHRQYYSANLGELIAAPGLRAQRTQELRQALGLPSSQPLTFAVTEVQLRYYVDDTIQISSLDGRTSPEVLRYNDPATGVPDFARYLSATRPDLVHVAQWCAIGDWRADVASSAIGQNLLCDWEKKTATLTVGDSFDWNGNRVSVVVPEIVRITWK